MGEGEQTGSGERLFLRVLLWHGYNDSFILICRNILPKFTLLILKVFIIVWGETKGILISCSWYHAQSNPITGINVWNVRFVKPRIDFNTWCFFMFKLYVYVEALCFLRFNLKTILVTTKKVMSSLKIPVLVARQTYRPDWYIVWPIL